MLVNIQKKKPEDIKDEEMKDDDIQDGTDVDLKDLLDLVRKNRK